MYTDGAAGAPCDTDGDTGGDVFRSPFAQGYDRQGFAVLELCGEIDLAAQLEVGPYVDSITTGARPQVVIDLRPVEFLDCSGLRLLVRARNRVVEHDGLLRLVCDERSPAHRILRRFGLLDLLEPVATVDEAVGEERA